MFPEILCPRRGIEFPVASVQDFEPDGIERREAFVLAQTVCGALHRLQTGVGRQVFQFLLYVPFDAREQKHSRRQIRVLGACRSGKRQKHDAGDAKCKGSRGLPRGYPILAINSLILSLSGLGGLSFKACCNSFKAAGLSPFCQSAMPRW